MSSYARPRRFEDFRIAVICALPCEYDAAILTFDEIWSDDEYTDEPTLRQQNNHMLGRIGIHNVVLVLLANMGKVSAANEVVRLRSIYTGLELAFLTGICGGVPSPGTDNEILLGDVVIGKSIVQYDLGRQYPSTFRRKDTADDNLSRLNKDVRLFLTTYETQHGQLDLQRRINKIIAQFQQMAIDAQNQRCYDRPATDEDTLFEPKYLHRHRYQLGCDCSEFTTCDGAIKASCKELGCDIQHQVLRKRLKSKRLESRIHVGRIGSGDTVMKSGEHRDRFAQEHEIIAFEMEGAGVWEEMPCIIVKGVCDYADSHKNKSWQDFSAAIAASATKALLERYMPKTVRTNSDISLVNPTSTEFTLDPILSDAIGVNHFVGRRDELRRLHEALKWTGQRRTAVLHGLGGIGKTQLSIEYTKRHRSDYSATLWLNARDETSLKQSFQQAAQRILRKYPSVAYLQNANRDIDETAEAVKRWLDEPRNDRWLVIYDNYDSIKFDSRNSSDEGIRRVAKGIRSDSDLANQPEATDSKAYDIRLYFPEIDHGAIVITTRSSTVNIGHLIRLSKLGDVDDSLAILASTSNRIHLLQDPNVYTLAHRLDGLPLALSTAGAYLNQVSTTCAEYLQLYDESWLRLQKESPQLLDYDRALYSTWGVSFRHIQKQNRNAAMLLQLWAYFDNEDLWYELLREGGVEGPGWLQAVTSDKINFNTTIRVLCEHGLVEADLVEANPPAKECGIDSRGYSVHGCVHAWMIHVLNTEVDEEMAWIATRCIASYVPSNKPHKFWLTQRRLLQHADRCITRTTKTTDLEKDAWAFHSLGGLYLDQGRLKEAKTMYERALQSREKTLEPEHMSTLDTVNKLGLVYANQGRLKDAEAMFERALQGREKLLGPEHASTLKTVNDLGLLYKAQGRLKDAKAMFEQALQGKEKVLGLDHTLTFDTVNNLGILYKDLGRFKDSEAMYERALQGYKKALGLDHISTLDTISNLGNLYYSQGRLKDAEVMHEQAFQGYKKALGLDHISTLDVVSNLGNLYYSQGRLKDAEDMHDQALQGYKNALGPHHTSTLSTISNLGNLYYSQGRFKEAETMFIQAFQGYKKALGLHHTSTLSKIGNLGNLYYSQGRFVEAETMYKQAFQGYNKALGPEHTSTLSILGNLGVLYSSLGRLKDAEAMYEQALQGKEKALGPDHTSTLSTVNNLGLLYKDQGRLKDAKAIYKRALEGYERVLGPDHTSTLDTVNNLGLLYKDLGRLKDAEAMYERALRGKERAWGPDHTSTLSTVNNLGILYKDQGRLNEAETMYRRALQGMEKVWGPDHLSTLDAINNLGLLYSDQDQLNSSQGQLNEAEAMFKRALQGYEKAIGPDAMSTYVPALNTLENLGCLFERLGETSKALSYYQRAESGFLSVFGPQNERYTDISGKISSLQSITLGVEKTDRGGLKARWRRFKGQLKGT